MIHKTTENLFSRLSNVKSTKELRNFAMAAEEKYSNISFAQYINEQAAKSGISAADLIRKAELQRNYGYQILNGTRNPGRDKVIALGLALNLSLDEVQRALMIAGEGALYPKNSRDSMIIFSINRQLCVSAVNELLFSAGKDTL